MKLARTFIILLLFIAACGGGSGVDYDSTVVTDSPPYVNRLDPAVANRGDTVTIFGFGFSYVPEYNIISLADIAVVAASHSFLATPVQNEIESLTFVVPSNINFGDYNIVVTVLSNPSNSNITLTVNP